MIYHGIDIIEIGRIRQAVERWGPRFLSRVYTEAELGDCGALGDTPRYGSLAARWAAKEAAAKALGAGLRGLGSRHRREFVAELGHQSALSLHDIEVARGAQGQPLLVLHGGAAALALELQLRSLALSLSHAHDYAVASVIGVVE